MQVKYYNSVNNQWEGASPLPPEEIYIGDTPPAQGINAKLWLDTSVTGLLPASYTVADNCEQTVAGQAVLDAHQGYLLQNQIDNLSEDFIVDQGTSGIWTYRKWNSGIAECWGSKSYTFAVTRQYQNVYISTSTAGAEPFPFSFTAMPTISTTQENSNGWLMFDIHATTTNTGTFFAVRPDSANSVDVFVAFHAIGRWK